MVEPMQAITARAVSAAGYLRPVVSRYLITIVSKCGENDEKYIHDHNGARGDGDGFV